MTLDAPHFFLFLQQSCRPNILQEKWERMTLSGTSQGFKQYVVTFSKTESFPPLPCGTMISRVYSLFCPAGFQLYLLCIQRDDDESKKSENSP